MQSQYPACNAQAAFLARNPEVRHLLSIYTPPTIILEAMKPTNERLDCKICHWLDDHHQDVDSMAVAAGSISSSPPSSDGPINLENPHGLNREDLQYCMNQFKLIIADIQQQVQLLDRRWERDWHTVELKYVLDRAVDLHARYEKQLFSLRNAEAVAIIESWMDGVVAAFPKPPPMLIKREPCCVKKSRVGSLAADDDHYQQRFVKDEDEDEAWKLLPIIDVTPQEEERQERMTIKLWGLTRFLHE